MSEQNFDPMTGQPIAPENDNLENGQQSNTLNTESNLENGGFDPMTGQPISSNAGFDPMTGQPISGNGGFDPMTGQPISSNAGFDPMTGQPISGNTGFDPMTGQPISGNSGFDPMTGQPISNNAGFDPMTGQPISGNAGFDPMTGQPISGNAGFDPMTGQPISGNAGFDPMTGQPISGNSGFDPMTGQPISGNAGFDPMTGQPIQNNFNGAVPPAQSGKSNKKAVIAVVLIVLLLVGAGAFATTRIISSFNDNKETSREVTKKKDSSNKKKETKKKDDDKEIAVASTTATTEDLDAVNNASTESTTTDEDVTLGSSTEASTATTTVSDDNLFSFTIDGQNYSLPVKVEDFMSKGWQYNEDSDATKKLSSGQTDYLDVLYKDDTSHRVSIEVTNFSLNAMEVKDCYISSVSLYDFTFDKMGIEVTTHGGSVVLGKTTIDEIKQIYGEPDYTSDSSSSYTHISYYLNHDSSNYNSSLSFMFEDDKPGVGTISVKNEVKPADMEEAKVSDEKPEYLSQYKAPDSLGDDLVSGNVTLEGKTYSVPFPMQLLLDDGWSYGKDDSYKVGAGEGYSVSMKKGDKRINVSAYNLSENATYLQNTMITSVTVRDHSSASFELPGGITIKSNDSDLKAVLDKQGITNYRYKKSSKYYTIPLDKNDTSDYPKDYIRIYINDDGSFESIQVKNLGAFRK